MIHPAAVDEFSRVCAALAGARSAGIENGCRDLQTSANRLGLSLDELGEAIDELKIALGRDDQDILAALERIRRAVDTLEYLVDDNRWPLPKYREMLFVY
jgi:glutamine synthetase